jgi:hypothetical protein
VLASHKEASVLSLIVSCEWNEARVLLDFACLFGDDEGPCTGPGIIPTSTVCIYQPTFYLLQTSTFLSGKIMFSDISAKCNKNNAGLDKFFIVCPNPKPLPFVSLRNKRI